MSENAVLEVPGLGKIKMMVWDLDETFWQGIFTEGGGTYLQAHHDLVIALALSVHRELAQRLMQIRRDWQVC